MATYEELLTAMENSTLRQKVRIAIQVSAEQIRTTGSPPSNQANRLKWASQVFESPESWVDRMTRAAVIQNRASTLASIIGASDSTVQTAIDAAVDLFANQLS